MKDLLNGNYPLPEREEWEKIKNIIEYLYDQVNENKNNNINKNKITDIDQDIFTNEKKNNLHDINTFNNKKKNKKDNQNINNNNNNKENVFTAFQKFFGRFPSPLQVEELNLYLGHGMEHGLLAHGLKKAAMVGTSFNYAIKVFDSWLDKGIFTLEAGLEEEQKYQKERGRAHASTKQSSEQEAGKQGKKLYW